MSLTDIKAKCQTLEKEYKLTDGFGMFLRVTPKGSKYWQMAYRFEGKQKLFSIGVYPAVSLSDARQRRDEARRLLAQGIDPNAKKQAEVKELKAKRDKTRSFSVVAKAWFSTKTKWSKDYGDSVWKRLETYVFPTIGDKDVAELDTGDLLVPVKRLRHLAILKLPCAFNNTLLRSCVMLFSRNLYVITRPMIWKVLFRNRRLNTALHWNWKKYPNY